MQAINWKMKKTVNQLGEKDKLEIKKLKKQSTKRENEVNGVWLWHAVWENMREFAWSDLTNLKKSAKP